METAKRIIALLVVMLLVAIVAQSAEKQAKTKTMAALTPAEISNTRSASCVVRVTAHPAALPLTFDTIQYLLHSSGVAGKAARDTLGLPPDAASDLFTIEELYSVPAVSMPLYPPGQTPPVGPGFGDYGNFESPSGEPPASPESISEPEQPAEEEIASPTTGYKPSPPLPGSVGVSGVPIPRSGYGHLGGYGGGFGGYGGGYGGGGYGGGGYGGGYGVYGGYGFSTGPRGLAPTNSEQPVAADEFCFHLKVDIKDSQARPAAEEFMNALVTNLRENLLRVWGEQRMRLDS